MADKKRIPLLSLLRRAIQKVRFLLSFDATRWMASSLKRSPLVSRQLSFTARPSLLDCTDDDGYEAGSSPSLSRTVSLLSSPASRTTSPGSEASRSLSGASSDDDINQRADRFIENFYRQLRMERQVSLQLRYCRKKSLEEDALK
ncbi:hypothetical protein MUK42_19845 [Musa troglodytarum]|uniref:DUF761 domain-containing protein n=1 Tax=Musa troglodytarum TaxID=320322 RepID=A0A9E7FTJ5_9LILI|nr:hypothetical protein MUK42_09043 [Musa troglodytarum]URE03722.1 hypothetical protein MUK42_19845 [Musa troglodytarum]